MGLKVECPPTWRGQGGVLVLGEAPGEEEVSRREGFVGASGRLLTRMLLAAGLSREEVSFSNVVKRRPPENNFQDVGEEELKKWKVVLQEEICQQGPQVVVACGNEALEALLGVRGISDRRGSCYQRQDGIWIVPMLHPAALLHGALWQEVPVGVLCLKRALELASCPQYKQRVWEERVCEEEEVCEWLEGVRECDRWSLDLETIPGDAPVVRVLGVALECEGKTRAASVRWPGAQVWARLQEVVEDCQEKLVNHNLLYDAAWLAREGVLVRKPLMDTMQAFRILEPELPKGLDFVTMWFLGKDMPFFKHEGRQFHKKKLTGDDWLVYMGYCMKDCVAALWASHEIEKGLRERGWWRAYQEEHLGLWGMALEMQWRPIVVDQHMVVDVAGVLMEEKGKRVRVLQELGLENPNSEKQVKVWLKGRGVKVPTKRTRNKVAETTDEAALLGLFLNEKMPELKGLIEVHKLQKLASSYIGPLLGKNQVCVGWTPDATETLRWTSSTHPVTQEGFNAQTVPKELRVLFPAPPGRVFVQPDLSQAEARYVAERAGCRTMQELFSDPGRSVHLERAKAIFGEEVKKSDPRYTLAKSSHHAGNYRMGPKRFSEQAGISLARARQILQADAKTRPEVGRWHQEVRRVLKQRGVLTNCWGWSRQFYAAVGAVLATGQVTDQEWQDAIAWEPQSAIPQVINKALLELSGEQWLWWHGHGHDSFLASVPEECVEEGVRSKIVVALRQPLQIGGRELVIPVDLQVGWSWGVMVPWEQGDTLEGARVKWEEAWRKRPGWDEAVKALLYVGGLE